MEDYEEKLIKKYMRNNDHKFPPILYHYTTQDGLLGILNHSRIWATDILYLNDAAEFHHSIALVKREIRRIVKSVPDKNAEKFVRLVLDQSKALAKFQIFVCSFSVGCDLLSQWRSYCPDNNGFSIRFEYAQLRDISKSQNFTTYLLPCFYDDNMIPELVKESFSDILCCFVRNGPSKKMIEEYRNKLLLLASIVKHESFRDEQEWRLFCFKERPVASSEIQFGKGKSMLLPYITVGLQGTNKCSPIKQIYIGPTPNKELSKKSVELLVKSKHLSCSVEVSRIPYRAW